MAVGSPSSPESQEPKLDKSEPENPQAAPQNPSSLPPPSSTRASAVAAENSSPNLPPNSNPNPNPNLNPNPAVVIPSPPSVPAFAPSFRPLGAPPVPQYSIPFPSFRGPMAQNPSIQPPGISAPVRIMLPGAVSGATASVSPMPPVGAYQVPSGQLPHSAPVPYGQVPNGYMGVPAPSPWAPAAIPPPGVPRYPAPYPTMIRPGFPPRPIPPIGMIPQLPRPPVTGIRGVPPIVTPVVRPVVPVVAPTEKPQTTAYVGKIALTVDDEFLLSLLRLCGPVKSWKRAQDPSNGTPKGFGFCEFESAEGVLRALRLLSNLNIDGQELMLKVDQATREYLELYVEKKTEQEKLKETEAGAADKESESTAGVEKQEPPEPAVEEKGKDSEDSRDKENEENIQKFGIVTDEDHQADRDALEKLTDMIEERLKTKPLPPPLPPAQTPAVGSAKSNSEGVSRSGDGYSDMGIMKRDAAEDKNDDETTSENKPATDYHKHETGSPDKSRKHDSKIKDRDRERDLKREKERELERYERERERERVRRERERELKLREAERLYKEHLKEWEAREKKKEYQRQYEKEREKERERERRREILKQEDDSDDDDDDSRKRRCRSSTLEEKRRKRQREKDDDLADKLKEEEQIAEAKKRAIEEQPPKDDMEPPIDMITENEKPVMQERKTAEGAQISPDQAYESISGNGDTPGDRIYGNSSGDELTMGLAAATDMKQTNNAPTRKLGFGLIGSGKRTTVLSVFHEEDDEDVDEKKMRPLVPLDYSTEEMQAVQTNASGAPANLVAAAELKKAEIKKERSRRSSDRFSQRERDRNNDESTHGEDESKEKRPDRQRVREDKLKTENKKLLDAKQLIDMIPKTKEELFVYKINWDIYDKHELHERMRPWISKKITEFLGEEEATLVDYIVSCIRDHMQATKLLELLLSILDDEAEMFVLKMWRMLIFEIKRVETGLQLKPRV